MQLWGKSLRGIFFARAHGVAMPSRKECGSYPLGERRLRILEAPHACDDKR